MRTGGCHCGAVRYEVDGEAQHHAICHCNDCRHHAGAPMVGWIAFQEDQLTVSAGTPIDYASSETGRRQFCGTCGTGLFYRNAEMLPGIVDIQSATLDDAHLDAPQAHIQMADRPEALAGLDDLPRFDRYPGP